jgi:hypothetical protein
MMARMHPQRVAHCSDAGECFARFWLRITDPDGWDAPDQVLTGVERILGVAVTSVTERI